MTPIAPAMTRWSGRAAGLLELLAREPQRLRRDLYFGVARLLNRRRPDRLASR